MQYDCISIGDCVFDVNLFIHDAVVHCRINKEDCELALKYGEKIPVDQIHRSLGGNTANNVVGLTRLGFKTAIYTIFGDDQIGERIGQYLEAEKIDKSLVQIEKGTESRYSTIINFQNERTILAYSVDRKYHLPAGRQGLPANLPETKWIYLSSVGPEYEEFFGEVVALAQSKNIKLAFAPTGAQLSQPRKTYQKVLEAAEIIFMNKEEALKMTNYQTPITNVELIKKLLFGIRDLGSKIVVITDGVNGSYAYDGSKYYQIGLFDLPVVQRTGAGDAYASGFMAAVMKGLPIIEAMEWGAMNSASVVSKMGTQTGLLTVTEMKTILEKNADFLALEV